MGTQQGIQKPTGTAFHWDNVILKINNDSNLSYPLNTVGNQESLETQINE